MEEIDLNYFKNVIEGNTEITWKCFWKTNHIRLKQYLPRQEYLQLKFGRLKRAAELLTQHEIVFNWTERADYHQAISGLVDSFCDEKGYLILSKQRKLFNGAWGDFLDGDHDSGRKKLIKYIEEIEKIKDKVAQADKVNDLEADAESFIDQGKVEVGLQILRLVIERFDGLNDLSQPAVNFAKEKIQIIKP